jgi:Predicted GTPases
MTTPQSEVLDQFNHLHGQILNVLDEGRKLGEPLGPLQTGLDPVFETARIAVSLSRLNLVVIGAEGHGKSTLINSIIGEDLMPREAQHPGTVAPVYLEWSSSAQPIFSVMLEGKDETMICKDVKEFAHYLLQKTNPKNKKKVSWER